MMWQGSLGDGAGGGGQTPKTGRMMKAGLILTPGSAGAPVSGTTASLAGNDGSGYRGSGFAGGPGYDRVSGGPVAPGGPGGPEDPRSPDSPTGPDWKAGRVSPGIPPPGRDRATVAPMATDQAGRAHRPAAPGCKARPWAAHRARRPQGRTGPGTRERSTRECSSRANFPAGGRRATRRRLMGSMAAAGPAVRRRAVRRRLRPTVEDQTAPDSTAVASPPTARCG